MDDDSNFNPRAAAATALAPLQPDSAECATVSTPSNALWMLLSATLPGEVVVEEIVQSPALHAEVKALAPQLQEAAKGCGEVAVKGAMKELFLHFRDKTEEARSPAFFRAYVRGLEVFPLDAVERGITAYINAPDSEFFPVPGPLIALVRQQAEPIIKAANRASRAAKAAAKPPPAAPLSSAERKALAAAMLDSLRRVPKEGDE